MTLPSLSQDCLLPSCFPSSSLSSQPHPALRIAPAIAATATSAAATAELSGPARGPLPQYSVPAVLAQSGQVRTERRAFLRSVGNSCSEPQEPPSRAHLEESSQRKPLPLAQHFPSPQKVLPVSLDPHNKRSQRQLPLLDSLENPRSGEEEVCSRSTVGWEQSQNTAAIFSLGGSRGSFPKPPSYLEPPPPPPAHAEQSLLDI